MRKQENPRALHYRCHGELVVAGRALNLRHHFKPQNL